MATEGDARLLLVKEADDVTRRGDGVAATTERRHKGYGDDREGTGENGEMKNKT